MTSNDDDKRKPGRLWFGWPWWVWGIIAGILAVAQPALEAGSFDADPVDDYSCYSSDGALCP